MITRWLWRNYRFSSSLKLLFKRRFTPAGFIVLGCMLASGAIGVDTNRAVGYQIFNLLAIVLGISLLWSMGPKPLIEAERVLPRVGTAGQPLVYQLWVVNRGSRLERSLSASEDFGDPRPGYEEFANTPEPGENRRNAFDRFFRFYRWMWLIARKQIATSSETRLPALFPGQPVEAHMEIIPTRRGQLRMGGLRFGVPDPFGLCRRYAKVKAPGSVLILPKRYTLPAIDLPGTVEYQPGGVNLATNLGENEEVVALREYRQGDPMRHIHWKSVGKTGKLIVKEFQNEYFVRHALILDTFPHSSESPVFEEAVSVAASFACTLHTQESLLDLMFVGPKAYCLTGGHGVAQLDHMLEVLAGVQPSSEPFEKLERLVLERAGLLSGCVCLFLHWDEHRRELASQLRQLGVPLLVLVMKEAGEKDPELGPMEADPQHFHVIEIGRVQEGLNRL